ncbi:MAG: hemolysin family protein [Chitinophagaceae bacterium]
MTIIFIIITILLIGFFAGIEIAFISVNKLSIELKKKQGKRSGLILGRFIDKPSRFIGTCLVGFNIFLVIYGLMVTKLLEPFWPEGIRNSGSLKVVLEVIVSTFFVLLVEFFFKAIFRAKNDWVLSFFAPVMEFFDNIFGWVARGFVNVAEWMLKYLFNIKVNDQRPAFSRGDLEHYYQQTKENDDDNQELNTELFENALSLPSVKLRSCLVPRKEIVAVDAKASVHTVKNKMIDTRLSRVVVYDGGIDNIIGYVHQLDLFKQPADIKSIIMPIPAVPETMSATELINKFSRERKSIAWVVDEFGGTSGIVTMEDLLEEIFGEIHDEYDTEEFVDKQLAETEYMFSGRMELDYLNEKYDLEFPASESETLSGYIINEHESMPTQNERIIIGKYQFDIMNMSDTKIELVKMRVL